MTLKPLIYTTLLLFATAGDASESDFYAGVKLRKIDMDYANEDLDESATTLGILLGYKLVHNKWTSLAMEAEFARSVSDGELDDPDVYPVKGQWGIKTQAIYGVFTFGTKVYGKLKLGNSRNEVSRKNAGAPHTTYKAGPTAGIGLGIRFTPRLMVEIENTIDRGGSDFKGTSLGVNYRF